MTADERAGAGPAAAVDEQDTEIGAAVRAILAARYQPKVGDRVRIRVSGECARTRGDETEAGILDGRTGTVDVIRDREHRDGHYIGVRLDRPVLGYHRAGVWATPSEVELVQP